MVGTTRKRLHDKYEQKKLTAVGRTPGDKTISTHLNQRILTAP